MSRRFNNSSGSDSLELLLDTLCNVFGGVVLIACLIAILPQKAALTAGITQAAKSKMLERRQTIVSEEIQRLESMISSHYNSTNPKLAEKQLKRDRLKRVYRRLRENQVDRMSQETNEAELRSIVMREDPSALSKSLRDLELGKLKLEGAVAASNQKIGFLEKRMADLKLQSDRMKRGRSQVVRFPRERQSSLRPLPIILQYDCIYPLSIGADLEGNPAIEKIRSGITSGFRAEPIQKRGMGSPYMDPLLGVTLKSAAAKGRYATIYLYQDSHQAFGFLKDALANAGLSYGLEFVDPDKYLEFSSEGSAPPEL